MKNLEDKTPKENNEENKGGFVMLDDYWAEGDNMDPAKYEEAWQRYLATKRQNMQQNGNI